MAINELYLKNKIFVSILIFMRFLVKAAIEDGFQDGQQNVQQIYWNLVVFDYWIVIVSKVK